MTYDDKPYVIEILDTAGTEQFSTMQDLYIKNTDGVILVFSLINRKSLDYLDNVYDKILTIHEENMIPVVIAANKSDLEPLFEVDRMEYPHISEKYKSDFFETSAKENKGLDDLFECIIRQILTEHIKVSKKKKKKRKCVII